MVIKNYAWYYTLHKKYASFTSGADGVAYDVRDSTCDQVYKLNSGASSAGFLSASAFTAYSSAIEETFNWVILKNGAVFLSQFDSGSHNTTGPLVAGDLSQDGTEVLAEDGEVWQNILNFYYPSISTEEISQSASQPQITSVVDCAGYGSKLSPGSIFCLFGQNLSLSTGGATTIPLPPSLNGTTILVNGVAAPILWTSSTQVNAQLPFETNVGIASLIVQVANAATMASQTITVNVTSPGVFTSSANGITIGAIEHGADGSLVNATSPAKAGEIIWIYLSGLGATNPTLPTGQAGNGQTTALTPTVSIGGQPAQVLFSGVSMYPGLYQIDAVVPNLLSGNFEIFVSSAGNTSQGGVVVPIAGSSISQSISATLTTTPQNGQAPLNVALTAAAGGTAAGTINYTFYCDRGDTGTNITPGYTAKFDGVSDLSKSTTCTYSNPGTYSPKVIVERGSGATQAQQSVLVSGSTLPPPAIAAVQPSSTSAGPSAQTITIVGTGFQVGLGLTFTPPSGNNQTLTGSQLQNFSSSTFQISVVLNVVGTWTVAAMNPDGQRSGTATITVAPQGSLTLNFTNWPPVFTVGDPPVTIGLQITNPSGGFISGTATATTANGQWLTVDGHTSDTWTIIPSTGSLTTSVSLTANPAGLAAGSYPGTITVSSPNVANSTATVSVLMKILTPLQITTSSLPTATWGQPYSTQLQATGGSGYVWMLEDGHLPPGLTLSSTGLISGTVLGGAGTGPQSFSFTVTLTNSDQQLAYRSISLLVQSPISLSASSNNFSFNVGWAYNTSNSLAVQVSGGVPPYSWSASGLPQGLTLMHSSDTTTASVTGTPTQAGMFSLAITATDSQGRSGSGTFVLTVIGLPLTVTSGTGAGALPTLSPGNVGTPYSQFLNVSGGSGSGYRWALYSGALPPGLIGQVTATTACSTCGFQITGTPIQAGSYMFTLIVNDSLNNSTTAMITIAINTGTPPKILTTTLNLATIGQTYSLSFSASGGAPPYQWSLPTGSPDAGLQISAAGVLIGTPSRPNDCSIGGPGLWIGTQYGVQYPSPTMFQVKVTDSAGQSSTGQFCLPEYYPTPQITSISPSSVAADGQTHMITVSGINFQNGARITNTGNGTPGFINSNALSFTLNPATPTCTNLNSEYVFSLSTGGCWGSGTYMLSIIQPYSYTSNPMSFTVR